MTATKEALSIDTATLRKAVQSAATFAAKKTTKPVLLCVKLESTEQGLSVTATDGEMSARLLIATDEPPESFSALVPAAHLAELLGKIEAETVEIETNGAKTIVRAGSGEFEILGEDPAEFPDALNGIPEASATVKADALALLLTRSLIAVAKEQSRYAINGVRLEIDGDQITAVGTDGRRLSIAECACNGMRPGACVVPADAARNLVRVLRSADGASVGLHIDSGRLVVVSERSTVSTQLLEDRFPQWQQVVPSGDGPSVTFDREDLIGVVDRVAVSSERGMRMVGMGADGDSSVSFSTEAANVGRGGESVDGQVDGEPERVAFNPDYLLDALRASDEATISVALGDSAAVPMLWSLGDGFRYVLMPVSGA